MIVMVLICPKPKCGGKMRLSGWDRNRGDSYVCEKCRHQAYYSEFTTNSEGDVK